MHQRRFEKKDFFVIFRCGETGIRTPETLLEFTRFPGVPLQPLEHLSLIPNWELLMYNLRVIKHNYSAEIPPFRAKHTRYSLKKTCKGTIFF